MVRNGCSPGTPCPLSGQRAAVRPAHRDQSTPRQKSSICHAGISRVGSLIFESRRGPKSERRANIAKPVANACETLIRGRKILGHSNGAIGSLCAEWLLIVGIMSRVFLKREAPIGFSENNIWATLGVAPIQQVPETHFKFDEGVTKCSARNSKNVLRIKI
jgi:hypothetical protein